MISHGAEPQLEQISLSLFFYLFAAAAAAAVCDLEIKKSGQVLSHKISTENSSCRLPCFVFVNGFAVASVVDMRISGEHISERINERKLLLLYKQPA